MTVNRRFADNPRIEGAEPPLVLPTKGVVKYPLPPALTVKEIFGLILVTGLPLTV